MEIRCPEGQGYRKILDCASSIFEEASKAARRGEEEAQEMMLKPCHGVVGNASQNGDQPSLAREGNSEADRRKLEELEQPRRFQEDEELYEEKALNQKRFARKMAATIQKNFVRAPIIALLDAPTVRLQLQLLLKNALLNARLSVRMC